MNLFTLSYGKSKKKMSPIMIDEIGAINVYLRSRTGGTGKEGRMDAGWFKVEAAPANSDKWHKKSSTIGGNKCNCVPHINRHGTTVRNGYISKFGFQQHT